MTITEEYLTHEEGILTRLGSAVNFSGEGVFEVRAVYREKNREQGAESVLQSASIIMVDDEDEELSQVYKENAFFVVYKTYSNVGEIIDQLLGEGIEINDHFPSIKVGDGQHWKESLIPSVSLNTDSPIRHFKANLDVARYGDEQLIGYKLPFYPSFEERLKEFIEYEVGDRNHIHLLIEDPRARLELDNHKVTLHTGVEVSLVGQVVKDDGVEKIQCDGEDAVEIDLQNSTSVELWVVGKHDQILDYISSSEYPYRYEMELDKKAIEEFIQEKINVGETIDCEFKTYIDIEDGNKKRGEIERGVCGLSNTNGGHLIIGVSDEKEILGIGPKVRSAYKCSLNEALKLYIKGIQKRLLENLTVNDCFKVSEIELQGEKLILISVRKSKKWNFIQSTQIPYARSGSNNYNATPLVAMELENKNRAAPFDMY